MKYHNYVTVSFIVYYAVIPMRLHYVLYSGVRLSVSLSASLSVRSNLVEKIVLDKNN